MVAIALENCNYVMSCHPGWVPMARSLHVDNENEEEIGRFQFVVIYNLQ